MKNAYHIATFVSLKLGALKDSTNSPSLKPPFRCAKYAEKRTSRWDSCSKNTGEKEGIPSSLHLRQACQSCFFLVCGSALVL